MTSDDAPEAELGELTERRGAIGRAIADLERALAAPAGSDRWSVAVADAMAGLVALGRQQRETMLEAGGLVEDLRTNRPRLVRRAEMLVDDIEDLITEMSMLHESVGSAEPQEIRDRALPCLGRVVRARQAMADLVWDAYWTDVGGVE